MWLKTNFDMKNIDQGTEFGQDLRDFDAEIKAAKDARMRKNHEGIEALSLLTGFEIEKKSDYHWRLTKPGCKSLDVWPQGSKTRFLGFKNPVRYRHDLVGFLDKHFSCI